MNLYKSVVISASCVPIYISIRSHSDAEGNNKHERELKKLARNYLLRSTKAPTDVDDPWMRDYLKAESNKSCTGH